jgi:capsule polysaccharide export protein KpsE/RkpR
MQEYRESSYYFIRLVIKHRKQFLVVTLLALICAVVFSSSWFIKPQFKSVGVVYPVNIKPYSAESESEQLLQLFEAADVRNDVIRKFNLASYYEIDTASAGGMAELTGTFESNVKVKRTEFESVEITVLDSDPEMARKMVNAMVDAMNAKAQALERSKAMEVVKVFADQVRYRKEEIDSLNSRMEELRVKYQILDYKSQSKEATKAWLKALGNGKGNVKDLDVMIRNLGEKGGEYYEMEKMLDGALKSYNNAKIDFDNAYRDLKKEITYANIVTKPVKADKKTYPIRWIIVLVSVVSANLFLLGVLMLMDERRKMMMH